MDEYEKLSNHIVLSACQDLRRLMKELSEHQAAMEYIDNRLEKIKKSEISGKEFNRLHTIRCIIERDIKTISKNINEIERFLRSPFGMMLSYGNGDDIFNSIKSEPVKCSFGKNKRKFFQKKERELYHLNQMKEYKRTYYFKHKKPNEHIE